FALGKFDLGTRVRQLAIRLRSDRLERTSVDQVEEIASLDKGAVPEIDVGNEAADARPNLDGLNRVKPSRELVPISDGSLDGLGDRDGRSGRGRRLCCRLFAAAREKTSDQNKDRRAIQRSAIGHSNRTRRLLTRAQFPLLQRQLRSIEVVQICDRTKNRPADSLFKRPPGSSKICRRHSPGIPGACPISLMA